MADNLGQLTMIPRSGDEFIHQGGSPLGMRLIDFWRWSASDLVSNATRGVLAEFIVAMALGIPAGGVRSEWDSFDLTSPEGITVEVKSAAYIQSWEQRALSRINFRTLPTRAWNAESNTRDAVRKRQAQVYVFALLAHTDKSTVDPLDVFQWEFWAVSTEKLDQRRRSQHSITINSLRRLAGDPITYAALRVAVVAAAGLVPT